MLVITDILLAEQARSQREAESLRLRPIANIEKTFALDNIH
jgi:hypothetical protein